MFQMESMHRRKGSGRLAELFGPAALERDKQQRGFEFEAAERDHYCRLAGGTEIGQYRLCVSDQCLPSPGQGAVPAVFVAAAHPRTLTGEDILLFCLGIFKTLNTKEEEERIRTLMTRNRLRSGIAPSFRHCDRQTTNQYKTRLSVISM